MKIPNFFKNEVPVAYQKKEFSSEAGARASFFYEWSDASPVELTFHAKKDSTLECVFLQNLSSDAKIPARVRVIADEGAKIQCTLVHQGALHSEIDLESKCLGSGSQIQIQALVNAKGTQKHALIAHSVHSVPHTGSDLKVWCVANDQSHTVFNGMITIAPGAHHTEAFQKNKNLMLSERSTIDSIPQLFISNDEVKCAHGSSTSTLEPEQYTYLQSRGIDKAQAEEMITRGFMESAVHWIESAETRNRVLTVMGLGEEEVWQ